MVKASLKQVHAQLEDCITFVASRKLPQGWPIIFEQIATTLKATNDPKALHAALAATYSLCKLYKFEIGSNRKGFDAVVEKLFGLLYEVGSQLAGGEGEQTAGFLKLIAKCFVSNVVVEISELLTKAELFGKWMQLFQKAFEWEVNPELEAPTEDDEIIKERKKSEVLKMKKSVARIFYEIFRKYGEAKLATGAYKGFSQFIEGNYASGIIKINLQVLQASQTKFVHPFILSLALKTMKETVKNKKFQTEIRAALPEILQNYAFPKLLLRPKDVKLWDEDPQEFVKMMLEEDIWDDYDPRFTAMQLIDIACSEKSYYAEGKDAFHPVLGQFLSFLTTVFDKSIKENNARAFDAALFAVGGLEEEIEKYQVLIDNIEPVIKQYILPNLKNPIGIIRMRCAWVYLKFASIEFKDTQSLSAAFEELVKALREKELPVKCMAALAISSLVSKESLANCLKPYVTEIISIYLELMKEIELEKLVEALNDIIKAFKEEIKPYALDLIKAIIKAYHKMFENTKGESEGDPESEMASSACLDAIGTIVEGSAKDQTVLQQAEVLLIPVILRSFTPERLGNMQSAVDLLARLSYYSQKTTPNLWDLFPLLINMVVGTPEEIAANETVRQEGGWAFENLKDLLIVLQNAVTRDPDGFLAGSCPQGSYVDLMFRLVNRTLEVVKCGKKESAAMYAIKPMITMLEALKVMAFA
eukprot:TRINITY_DN7175_c0_g3_i1.p1 TRINITY_DN7175_c0_g3~~TRINITY_DN7175_c0_g3_i1.p1  ORF type:complete len:701 (-),score=219.21 TRINITY_DN7175_c0_g3_i1:2507-4609(-)